MMLQYSKDMLRGKKYQLAGVLRYHDEYYLGLMKFGVNVFNYINEIIQHVKPRKTALFGL